MLPSSMLFLTVFFNLRFTTANKALVFTFLMCRIFHEHKQIAVYVSILSLTDSPEAWSQEWNYGVVGYRQHRALTELSTK